jgi:hypothetical protein
VIARDRFARGVSYWRAALSVPKDVHRAKHLLRLRERMTIVVRAPLAGRHAIRNGARLIPAFLPPRNSSVPCCRLLKTAGSRPMGRVQLGATRGRGDARAISSGIPMSSAGRHAAQSKATGSGHSAQRSCGMRVASLPGPTCFAPTSGSPLHGPVRRSADAPPADALYFKNLVASNASFRLSISQAVRARRAARMEIALAFPCCFSSRATKS